LKIKAISNWLRKLKVIRISDAVKYNMNLSKLFFQRNKAHYVELFARIRDDKLLLAGNHFKNEV